MHGSASWRIAVAAAAALVLTGCGTTRPRVPSDWRIASTRSPEITGLSSDTGEVVSRPPTVGVMQVLVAYGPVLQTHAAIRLAAGPDRIVHWDPGGDFGRRDPGFNRVNDVMSGASSSLQRIWHFRRSACGNDAMLVFEFDMPIRTVAALQDALVYSAKNPSATDAFKTLTTPSQCTRNLCKFLRTYSPDEPYIPTLWLYPHELGEHMWTQNPDRVVLFRHNERPAVFIPPTTRAQATAAR